MRRGTTYPPWGEAYMRRGTSHHGKEVVYAQRLLAPKKGGWSMRRGSSLLREEAGLCAERRALCASWTVLSINVRKARPCRLSPLNVHKGENWARTKGHLSAHHSYSGINLRRGGLCADVPTNGDIPGIVPPSIRSLHIYHRREQSILAGIP